MTAYKWIRKNAHFSIGQVLYGMGFAFFGLLVLLDVNIVFAGAHIKPDAEPITVFNDLPHSIGWIFIFFALNDLAFQLPFNALSLGLNPFVNAIIGRKAMSNINAIFAKDEAKSLEALKMAGIIYADPSNPAYYRLSDEGTRELRGYIDGDTDRLITTGEAIKERRDEPKRILDK